MPFGFLLQFLTLLALRLEMQGYMYLARILKPIGGISEVSKALFGIGSQGSHEPIFMVGLLPSDTHRSDYTGSI